MSQHTGFQEIILTDVGELTVICSELPFKADGFRHMDGGLRLIGEGSAAVITFDPDQPLAGIGETEQLLLVEISPDGVRRESDIFLV